MRIKKAITEKAFILGLRVTDEPVNMDDRNYGYKYFLESISTHQVVGRFDTQRCIEYWLDEEIEFNRAKDARAQKMLVVTGLWVACRENNGLIEKVQTYKEGLKLISFYEKKDRELNIYTKDFYTIVVVSDNGIETADEEYENYWDNVDEIMSEEF